MVAFRWQEDMCRVQLYHSLWPGMPVPFVHSTRTPFAQYLAGRLDLHRHKNVSPPPPADVDITFFADLLAGLVNSRALYIRWPVINATSKGDPSWEMLLKM